MTPREAWTLKLWLESGGLTIYPVLLASAVALGVAFAYLLKPSRRSLWVGVSAAVITLAVGYGGMVYERRQIEAVLPLVAPEMVDQIRTQGYAESEPSRDAGVTATLFTLALLAIGGALGRGRSRTAVPSAAVGALDAAATYDQAENPYAAPATVGGEGSAAAPPRGLWRFSGGLLYVAGVWLLAQGSLQTAYAVRSSHELMANALASAAVVAAVAVGLMFLGRRVRGS